jgi:trigger factor
MEKIAASEKVLFSLWKTIISSTHFDPRTRGDWCAKFAAWSLSRTQGGEQSKTVTQIWQRVEADLKAGNLDPDDQGKDEDTLKADYRKIAERRIRLGLLLSEIGRVNNINVTNEELSRAMRQEAARYPGQEQQVMEFFRKNPQAADNLRSPIFEEKVVDFMLELAKVTDRQVTPEELSAPAEAA